jgi:redox-sensitive bicupin YhaK (pirin superfamily)
VTLSVIAGEALGLRSPVVAAWPTLYVHAWFTPGAVLDMPTEHEERAVYVAQGELATDGGKIVEGQLAALAPGVKIRLRANGEARAMLLGGARFTTPRHIWWNFVASSPERIELAKERWAKREFPPVPGETEFIPLPSH